jgi:hypothetical protein
MIGKNGEEMVKVLSQAAKSCKLHHFHKVHHFYK